MLQHPVDMQTIVIIGNSQTYAAGDYMITPRGYLDKYELSGIKQSVDICNCNPAETCGKKSRKLETRPP